jgi:hypothetical protein
LRSLAGGAQSWLRPATLSAMEASFVMTREIGEWKELGLRVDGVGILVLSCD